MQHQAKYAVTTAYEISTGAESHRVRGALRRVAILALLDFYSVRCECGGLG